MNPTWESRIDQFWDSFDRQDPGRMTSEIRELLSEREVNDAAALYERASVHDSLGEESDAVVLYRRALDIGLDAKRKPQARIQ